MKQMKRIAALLLAAVLLLTLLSGAITVFAESGGVVTLFRISVQTKPNKLHYLQGEELDLTGLVVKTVYSDNSTGIANNNQVTVSGYNPNVVGEQTITVKYSGKSTNFKVTVYSPGDANGDGTLDGTDVTLLLQYAAGWDVTLEEQFADANGDGKIDGNDATLMMQYVAGWEVTLG